MIDPVVLDTRRHLDYEDRALAEQEGQPPEVRPCLECGKEQDHGMWCGATCFMKWDAKKKGYTK